MPKALVSVQRERWGCRTSATLRSTLLVQQDSIVFAYINNDNGFFRLLVGETASDVGQQSTYSATHAAQGCFDTPVFGCRDIWKVDWKESGWACAETAWVPFIKARFAFPDVAATFFDAWRLILLLFKSDMSDYACPVIIQCLKNKTLKIRGRLAVRAVTEI